MARVVKAERGRLRNASAPVVLAVLSGAALAPVVAAVATGSGVAGALVTLAGVAGNVGSGHLTRLVEKLAERTRDKSTDPQEPEAVRGTVEAELLAALAKSDSGAQELRIQLTDLLLSVDGMTMRSARPVLSCASILWRACGNSPDSRKRRWRSLTRWAPSSGGRAGSCDATPLC